MDVINVCTPGHADPYDSFGLIACQLARHLTTLGAYVNLLPLGSRVMDSQPADVRSIAEQPIKGAYGGILLGWPTVHPHYGQLANIGRRVAVTMFESSRLPSGWTERLNTLDAIVVPSRFCEDVFLNCGVTTPIHVIPLGIGEAYKPAGRATDRPFTFLAFLDRGLRKGGLVALQAFQMAFGDDPAYRLILKSRRSKVNAEITNPNITLIQRDMTEQELYELYLECDCLVNPNRGEGFGLLPLEFAATGGIALATDWGGTGDYIRRIGVPLPYRLVKADWRGHKTLGGQELGNWAEVSPDEVAEVMRRVADNRSMHSFIARLSAPVVREQYDWRTFAERVYEVWRGESKQLEFERCPSVFNLPVTRATETQQVL
jgi:glycosyltransferase involved in cell wall biosynthesis